MIFLDAYIMLMVAVALLIMSTIWGNNGRGDK